MRVLVTWGSKHGGTEGIARILGDALERHGFDVEVTSVGKVSRLDTFDAVIVGGALYANRWPSNVRWFVGRHLSRLRQVPVWFFSSGPLDDSAEHQDIPATRQVGVLAERVGARGHITFGGRLERDAKGFPASAMAKEHSGDWRNPEHIRAWADRLAIELPHAAPGTPVPHRAAALPRLLAHGVLGWAVGAVILAVLSPLIGITAARIVHTLAVPFIFSAVGWHYFRVRGAREPLPTAVVWTALVALLDLVIVAGLVQRDVAMFSSILAVWLPLVLVFLTTWAVGEMMAMMPETVRAAKQVKA
ncbi:MAG TPA: flavodoxin domain-containing protein [Archangium sp.]|uniref:flavodoxin domain-containing protein n=1 Tax=Archangium sp. TaxID=1872627 RepID=UPI002E36C64C|nr:flavodoxin domain-containing protein [Archangium sp.]HEX5753991.1 flavodoxin domain-containing protein [Archangium sp.]